MVLFNSAAAFSSEPHQCWPRTHVGAKAQIVPFTPRGAAQHPLTVTQQNDWLLKGAPHPCFPFLRFKKKPTTIHTEGLFIVLWCTHILLWSHTCENSFKVCVCVGGVWQRVHFAFTDGAPWRHRSHMVRRRAVIAHTHGPHGNPTQLISLRGTTGRPTSLQSDSTSPPPRPQRHRVIPHWWRSRHSQHTKFHVRSAVPQGVCRGKCKPVISSVWIADSPRPLSGLMFEVAFKELIFQGQLMLLGAGGVVKVVKAQNGRVV